MLPESELILNSRGAIYHLNLRPEEIADTIFLVGDQDRVAKVSKHFDQIIHRQQHREFIAHTGTIGQKSVTVLSTGIGPDNIDIAINELDALANINFNTRTINAQLKQLQIIRLGTSGALQADIPVDALVVSTHGLGFDNVLNYYEHDITPEDAEMINTFIQQTEMDTRITMPYVFAGSQQLIEQFGQGFYKGITVTAPGFYGPQGRELRLKSRTRSFIDKLSSFSHQGHRITNFEMESSAIFGLCKLLGHHCTSVNVVVANRVAQKYSKDANAAVEQMIEKVLGEVVG